MTLTAGLGQGKVAHLVPDAGALLTPLGERLHIDGTAAALVQDEHQLRSAPVTTTRSFLDMDKPSKRKGHL